MGLPTLEEFEAAYQKLNATPVWGEYCPCWGEERADRKCCPISAVVLCKHLPEDGSEKDHEDFQNTLAQIQDWEENYDSDESAFQEFLADELGVNEEDVTNFIAGYDGDTYGGIADGPERVRFKLGKQVRSTLLPKGRVP